MCAQTHHGVRDNLDVEGSATTGFDRRLRSDSWHCGNSHGRGSAQKRLIESSRRCESEYEDFESRCEYEDFEDGGGFQAGKTRPPNKPPLRPTTRTHNMHMYMHMSITEVLEC